MILQMSFPYIVINIEDAGVEQGDGAGTVPTWQFLWKRGEGGAVLRSKIHVHLYSEIL